MADEKARFASRELASTLLGRREAFPAGAAGEDRA